MRILRYLLAGTFFASALVAQQADPNSATGQQPAPTLTWIDHQRIATWSAGVIQTDQHTGKKFFAVVGSGIFVAIDTHTGYLVTAKHVFFDPAENWHPTALQLRFAWQEDKSVFEEFGVTLTLRDTKGNNLWKGLDDNSDLAAILPPSDLKTDHVEAIFPDSFADDSDLFQGVPVIVLGFPGFVGSEYLVRAIVRQGVVAWTNPRDPLHNIFMVDANLYPGNSGGPVFRVPSGFTKEGSFMLGGKAKFLGIVTKVPLQDAPVTVDGQPLNFTPPGQLPSANHPVRAKVVGLGGVGIIEPASKVLALVQSFQTRK